MSKISKKLEWYQIQMSIYAEQHKIILANDVLDMIEQLQEDLEDDIEKVVAELEEHKTQYGKLQFAHNDANIVSVYVGKEQAIDCAIDIVRRGCAE